MDNNPLVAVFVLAAMVGAAAAQQPAPTLPELPGLNIPAGTLVYRDQGVVVGLPHVGPVRRIGTRIFLRRRLGARRASVFAPLGRVPLTIYFQPRS